MKRTLALIVVFFMPCFSSCERNAKETGFEVKILSDMVHPVPYEAYSPNDNFSNGATMQSSIEGTVYRGTLLTTSGSVFPFEYSKLVHERGKDVYKNYCLVCHGEQGDGDGPLIPKFPNPPAFSSRRVMDLDPLKMFETISHGKMDMPGHAGQIDAIDRWKVIYYVEYLQGKRK